MCEDDLDDNEGTTRWCESCQVFSTFNVDNPYGTCMCS